MTDHTKRFIEDYIDEINKNNWQFIFDSWYEETYEVDVHTEAKLFDDFIAALQNAKVIKSIDEFKEERAETIKAWLDKIIQENIDGNFQTQSKWEVPYDELFNQLYSWLGFSITELESILDELEDAELTPQASKRTLLIEM